MMIDIAIMIISHSCILQHRCITIFLTVFTDYFKRKSDKFEKTFLSVVQSFRDYV